MKSKITRRRVLRGMLGGAAVTVGLPFLECFLNANGTALASGTPIPTRFGTWFWGLGMNPSVFVPKRDRWYVSIASAAHLLQGVAAPAGLAARVDWTMGDNNAGQRCDSVDLRRPSRISIQRRQATGRYQQRHYRQCAWRSGNMVASSSAI